MDKLDLITNRIESIISRFKGRENMHEMNDFVDICCELKAELRSSWQRQERYKEALKSYGAIQIDTD